MADPLDPKAVRPRTFEASKSGVLAAWLSEAVGAPVTLTAAGLLGGGAVQENWRIDVAEFTIQTEFRGN